MINYIIITPDLFDFVFRWPALLSLVAIVIDSALICLILSKGKSNEINRWFALALLCMVLWGVGEFLGRISKTAEATILWGDISVPGYILVSVFFFIFVLKVTKNDKILNNSLPQFLLASFAVIMLFLTWKTNLFINRDPATYELRYFGWQNSEQGLLFILLLAWVEIFFIVSLLLLFRQYAQIKEGLRKKQSLFIISGLLIPLGGGTITEGILPILNINPIEMSVFLTMFLSILVTYAIFKYKLFVISPFVAFYSIIETMTEALIILSPSFYVERANKAALDLLGYKEKELLGEPIQNIIEPGNAWKTFQERGLQPLKNGRPVKNLETTFLTKGEKPISINFSASPIKEAGQDIVGIVAVASDITQTKNLIRKLEQIAEELRMSKYQLEKRLEAMTEAR